MKIQSKLGTSFIIFLCISAFSSHLIKSSKERFIRSGRGDSKYLWPKGQVLYYIEQDTFHKSDMRAIFNAMDSIESVTCIKFVENSFPPELRARYFLNIVNTESLGCRTYVGYQGNRKEYKYDYQNLSLDTFNCLNGNFDSGIITKNLIHAIGFRHEQTRDDRDDFIEVDFTNLNENDPSFQSNFIKDSQLFPDSWAYNGVYYNFDSIMHNHPKAGAVDPNYDVLIPNVRQDDGNVFMGNAQNMGQRRFISKGDIQMIQTAYQNECGIGEFDGTDVEDFWIIGVEPGESDGSETIDSILILPINNSDIPPPAKPQASTKPTTTTAKPKPPQYEIPFFPFPGSG